MYFRISHSLGYLRELRALRGKNKKAPNKPKLLIKRGKKLPNKKIHLIADTNLWPEPTRRRGRFGRHNRSAAGEPRRDFVSGGLWKSRHRSQRVPPGTASGRLRFASIPCQPHTALNERIFSVDRQKLHIFIGPFRKGGNPYRSGLSRVDRYEGIIGQRIVF